MDCGDCGASCPPGARFCGSCGSPVVVDATCPTCGRGHAADQRFCSGCGTDLTGAGRGGTEPEGQRRHLTVMFCDLVGSTALAAELDPEEMREIILAYQTQVGDAVHRNHGYIGHYMGDGVLVYFGYPSAHEADAANAVTAGLEVVAAAETLRRQFGRRDLQIRAGVHTGEVVVSDMGSGARKQEADIVGDTPNLAARLQGAAQPDELVISEATHDRVTGLFAVVPLGGLRLKGFAAPVRAYQVTAASGARNRFEAATRHGLSDLVGREDEWAALVGRWTRVEEGPVQAVAIAGEPGLGKSRLVRELVEHVREHGGTVLELFCNEQQQNTALHPVLGLVRHRIDRDAVPGEAPLDRLVDLVDRLGADPETTVPGLATMLGIEWEERFRVSSDGPERRMRLLLDGLRAMIVGQQPALLIAEDLHWADPTTLELLHGLIDVDAAILLVATHRLELATPWPAGGRVEHVTLGRLGPGPAQRIVEQVAGKPVPVEVLGEILARADGIPLHVEELTRTVIGSGALTEGHERWEATGVLPDSLVPATLRDSLMARLDRIPGARELAQLAATVGRESPLALLEAASGAGADLDRHLAQLVEADILERTEGSGGVVYRFSHSLVRDVAYESMLRSDRARRHGELADLLVGRFAHIGEARPEQVADHLLRAGRDAEALPHLVHAGRAAWRTSASREAMAAFERALQVIEGMPPSAERDRAELELRMEHGAPLTVLCGYSAPAVDANYARARELCRTVDNERSSFFAIYGTWRVHLLRGEYRTAKELAQRLQELAAVLADPVLDVAVARAMGGTLFYLDGPRAEAEAHLRIPLGDVRPTPDVRNHFLTTLNDVVDPWVACASYLGWTTWMLGDAEGAVRHHAAAVADAREAGHPFSLALSLAFSSWLHQFRGDTEACLAAADEVRVIAEEQGFAFWTGWAEVLIGWAWSHHDPQRGQREMEQGLQTWRSLHSELGTSYFQWLVADGHARLGNRFEALHALAGAEAVMEKTGEGFWAPMIELLRADLVDDPDAAAGHRRAALDLALTSGSCSLQLRVASSMVSAAADGRSREAALAELRTVLDRIDPRFRSGEITEARALLDAG